MIISLADAQLIDTKITQNDLDAFETSIRRLTNNNFQNRHIRFNNIKFIDDSTMEVNKEIIGLKKGDTIEVNYSHYNDGLYIVDELVGNTIKVGGTPFYVATVGGAMVTKVEYPVDIAFNIKKLIEYDKKMGSKVGIKSETISRMSTTYYDVNSTENTEGYPSNLLSFLNKYEKMRW